jgi:hypothetical protein
VSVDGGPRGGAKSGPKPKPKATGATVLATVAKPLGAVASGAPPGAVVAPCPLAPPPPPPPPVLYVVSGSVAALLGFERGVTVTLTGPGVATQTVTTGADGSFTFAPVLETKVYTVAVARGALAFAAASQSTGSLKANQSLAFAFKTYQIDGMVRRADEITGEVRMALAADEGGVIVRPVLDAKGKFSVVVPEGSAWSLKPTHPDYTVTTQRPEGETRVRNADLPPPKKPGSPREAELLHVLCTVERAELTGRLATEVALPEPRPRVVVEGTDLAAEVSSTYTYSMMVPVGTHTVSVEWADRVFEATESPNALKPAVAVARERTTVVDFRERIVWIEGTVSGLPPERMREVVISLDGFPGTTSPHQDTGKFTLREVPARTAEAPVAYTLTASHPNYAFTPPSHVLSPLIVEPPRQLFAGRLEVNLSADGRITLANGTGVGGRVVRLLQGTTLQATKTTLATGAPGVIGTFRFGGLVSGKSYRIEPDPPETLSLSLTLDRASRGFSPLTKSEVGVAFVFTDRAAITPGERVAAGIAAEMETKILQGEVRQGGKAGDRIVGGHSGTLTTTMPAGVRQEPGTTVTTNPNGTRSISIQGQLPDGTWSPPKTSSLPPPGWTNEDFLRAATYTAKHGVNQGTVDGTTRRRAVLRRAPGEPAIPWVVLTDRDGNVTCAYPTA